MAKKIAREVAPLSRYLVAACSRAERLLRCAQFLRRTRLHWRCSAPASLSMPQKAQRLQFRRRRRAAGSSVKDEDPRLEESIVEPLPSSAWATNVQSMGTGHSKASAGSGSFATLSQTAALLWLPSYSDLFREEIAHNECLTGWVSMLQPSSYRRPD